MAREDWEIAYRLIVDGVETEIVLAGSNKKDAWDSQIEDQWELYYPNKPLPKRYRCKLEEIDRTFHGMRYG